MAVAMEAVAWRGLDVKKKRRAATWGADAHELMQMMMGQLRPAAGAGELSTLDLLGPSSCSSSSGSSGALQLRTLAAEFLELDPEEPLPSGWEKCLNLKTGKVSFVNKSSGVSTLSDPRKQRSAAAATPHLAAHEFLGSKRSEENSLRASSPSSSGMGRKQSFLESEEQELFTVLELDLNLAAGGSSSPSRANRQTVCTMEMIQNALKRTTTASPMTLKREMPRLQQQKLSASPSFSSLTNSARSDPIDTASPSTSSSSSTSSRFREHASRQPTGACEGDSKVELAMGACTRCLMYVMLQRVDPRCPRCESVVPVDFSAPPCKRQRVVSDRG